MPRRFTLRRLLINVTLVCLICALVKTFPTTAIHVSEYLGLFVPAIFICMIGATCSARPWESLSIGLAGAALGYLVAPVPMHMGPPAGTGAGAYLEVFQTIAPWPAGGALVFTLASVGFFRRSSPATE